jgi:hypothetical protein
MYAVGQQAHLTATFKDVNGALFDPTTVTATITKPDGTAAAGSPFTAVRDSIGQFHYDYTTTVAGIHQWFFTGTGAGGGVQTPDVFTVIATTTAALISLSDAKETLNYLTAEGTVDDQELLLTIRAATEVINELAGYTIVTSVTETVDSTVDRYGRGVVMLSRIPVLTVQTIVGTLPGAPTVTVDANALDIITGEYVLGTAGFYGPQKVTYTAGRAAVPSALQEACRIEVQQLWATQRGTAATVPAGGLEGDTGMADLSYRIQQLIKLAGHSKNAGVV